MTTRRVTFNLNGFLEELQLAVIDRPDLIDDTVERYKNFLSRTTENIRNISKDYINKHTLVAGNEEVKSYIDYCHNLDFEN